MTPTPIVILDVGVLLLRRGPGVLAEDVPPRQEGPDEEGYSLVWGGPKRDIAVWLKVREHGDVFLRMLRALPKRPKIALFEADKQYWHKTVRSVAKAIFREAGVPLLGVYRDARLLPSRGQRVWIGCARPAKKRKRGRRARRGTSPWRLFSIPDAPGPEWTPPLFEFVRRRFATCRAPPVVASKSASPESARPPPAPPRPATPPSGRDPPSPSPPPAGAAEPPPKSDGPASPESDGFALPETLEDWDLFDAVVPGLLSF